MRTKGIGPQGLGCSPIKQTKSGKAYSKELKPVKKKNDPNKFTRNYNAATGITHEFMQDDGGNSVTPGYDFKKADQYKANAIKKYGSLEAARKAYSSRHKKMMNKD